MFTGKSPTTDGLHKKGEAEDPTFLQRWHDHAQNTSIHGMRIIGDPQVWWFRRLCWAVLFIASMFFVFFPVINLVNKTMDPPIQTETNLAVISNWSFPAVTICNQNAYRRSYILQHPEHTSLLRLTFPDIITSFLNTTEITGSSIISGNVTDIFYQASHNIPRAMFLCQWKDKTENCTEIFEPVKTPYGFCYKFNSKGDHHVTLPGEGLKVYLSIEQDEYTFGPNVGTTGVKVSLDLCILSK